MVEVALSELDKQNIKYDKSSPTIKAVSRVNKRRKAKIKKNWSSEKFYAEWTVHKQD